MVMTLGTRGEGGKSLTRDIKSFKDNFDDIDFDNRVELRPRNIRGCKKTYVYGAAPGDGIDYELECPAITPGV